MVYLHIILTSLPLPYGWLFVYTEIACQGEFPDIQAMCLDYPLVFSLAYHIANSYFCMTIYIYHQLKDLSKKPMLRSIEIASFDHFLVGLCTQCTRHHIGVRISPRLRMSSLHVLLTELLNLFYLMLLIS